MKKHISLFTLSAILFFAGNLFAQSQENNNDVNPNDSKECNIYSYARPVAQTRGKSGLIAKIPAKPEIQKVLPKSISKSRGKKPACMISFYNYNNQKVHVFVDSNYIGTLQANSLGVVETLKSYNNVYCVTDDKSFQWKQNGECKCTFVYHLRLKEGEGEIKY